MVRIEPGPKGGLPGDGEGRRSEGNSSRWAFGPSNIAYVGIRRNRQGIPDILTIPASSLPRVNVTALYQ